MLIIMNYLKTKNDDLCIRNFRVLAHWLGTWYASYQIGEVSRLWKGYTNAPSVLYSSAIFVFFKYFPNKSIMNILEKISSYFKM